MGKITVNQLLATPGIDADLSQYASVISRSKRPTGIIDVVLDTDTYNEIDDQYALAFMSECQDKLNICGIFAAPFYNHHSDGPADGMEKSYHEIFKVLNLTGHTELEDRVFRGSNGFLPNEETPIESPAALRLIDLAMEHSPERPLYVACIAAPTNIASAILMEPRIVDRIVVVWCGGVGLDWPDSFCFNGCQDIAASRVLLGSGVALVLIPARGVGYAFALSGVELEYWLKGRSPFCDYILERTKDEARMIESKPAWSRQIVDVLPIAWLLGDNYTLDRMDRRPMIGFDKHYTFDPRRPLIRYIYSVKRDNIANVLLGRLGHIPEMLDGDKK